MVLRDFDPAALPALYLTSRAARHDAQAKEAAEGAGEMWADVLGALDAGGGEKPQLVLNHRNPLVRRVTQLSDPALAATAVEALYWHGAAARPPPDAGGRHRHPQPVVPGPARLGRRMDEIADLRRPGAGAAVRRDRRPRCWRRRCGGPRRPATGAWSGRSGWSSPRPTSTAPKHAKAFAAFARCLADHDAEPGGFGEWSLHNVLWHFKWIVGDLRRFPEVPLARTHQMLDDMERRYRESGNGLHAVYAARCAHAAHLGDFALADELYHRWTTTPATS